MSTFDSNDMGMPGYFLPEDSQSRLKKLHDQITFLSRLAQPRSWNEQKYALEVPAGELAICLESLAEQLAMVLDETSWPAQRQVEAGEESEGDVAPAELPKASGAAAEGFAYVTLDRFDALDRLIQTLSAHGDVVACSRAAEPQVGQAIDDGVEAVRAILHEVETRQIGQPPRPRNRVGETPAVYDVGLVSRGTDAVPIMMLPAPTSACAGQSRGMRSH
jgi:hypothetical protein